MYSLFYIGERWRTWVVTVGFEFGFSLFIKTKGMFLFLLKFHFSPFKLDFFFSFNCLFIYDYST